MDLDVSLCYGFCVDGELVGNISNECEETKEEKKISALMKKRKLVLVSNGICYTFNDSYVLAVKESKRCENLGQIIQADPEWSERLEQFCKDTGIAFKKPEWRVCAYFEE